jgi:hypothetical protein
MKNPYENRHVDSQFGAQRQRVGAAGDVATAGFVAVELGGGDKKMVTIKIGPQQKRRV